MPANGTVQPTPEAVSVTIPAEYVEDFRAAVIAEIATSVTAVKDDYKELHEAEGWLPERVDSRQADLETSTRLLVQDTDLLGRMGGDATGLTGEDVEVRADAATLAHAFEAMARHVIEPRLRDVVGISPLDAKYAGKARLLMGRLWWAVERAAEYHDKATAARERAGG